jgi:hypothetical protein
LSSPASQAYALNREIANYGMKHSQEGQGQEWPCPSHLVLETIYSLNRLTPSDFAKRRPSNILMMTYPRPYASSYRPPPVSDSVTSVPELFDRWAAFLGRVLGFACTYAWSPFPGRGDRAATSYGFSLDKGTTIVTLSQHHQRGPGAPGAPGGFRSGDWGKTILKKKRPLHVQWPFGLRDNFKLTCSYQLTVTLFEQVDVPASHTLYVAEVRALGGLSVYASSLGVVTT